MPELGRAALVVCFGLALYAVVAGFWGAHTRRRRLSRSAQNALVAAFSCTLVASAVLLVALARSDFTFTYVAQHTSRELPTPYKLASFYGGQEGSLLLWLLVLTGYSTAAVLPPASLPMTPQFPRPSAMARKVLSLRLLSIPSQPASKAR